MKRLLLTLVLLMSVPTFAEWYRSVEFVKIKETADAGSSVSCYGGEGWLDLSCYSSKSFNWYHQWGSDSTHAEAQGFVKYEWTWNDGGDPNNVPKGGWLEIDFDEGHVIETEIHATFGDPYGRSYGGVEADADASNSGNGISISCSSWGDAPAYGYGDAGSDTDVSPGHFGYFVEDETEEERYCWNEADGWYEWVNGPVAYVTWIEYGQTYFRCDVSAHCETEVSASGYNVEASADATAFTDPSWDMTFTPMR